MLIKSQIDVSLKKRKTDCVLLEKNIMLRLFSNLRVTAILLELLNKVFDLVVLEILLIRRNCVSGLLSAGLPCSWLLVVGKCRFTRQLAFVEFNLKNSNQLFIWRFVFGSS